LLSKFLLAVVQNCFCFYFWSLGLRAIYFVTIILEVASGTGWTVYPPLSGITSLLASDIGKNLSSQKKRRACALAFLLQIREVFFGWLNLEWRD
jgi:hypothetical protein